MSEQSLTTTIRSVCRICHGGCGVILTIRDNQKA